mgnify:CR=1 FL=1
MEQFIMGLSSLEQKALDFAPSADVYVKATVTSSERITIPASMIGRFVTFQADTSAVFLKFGAGAVTAANTAVSSGTTSIAAATNGCIKLAAGDSLSFKIPSTITDFAHISADTSGYLRFWDSTGSGEP